MANMSNSTGAVNATSNDVTDDDIIELPIVVSYLILLFRILSTLFVTVVGIAVSVVVIREKDQLKGRHVLLIVNLMVSGIMSALNATIQSSIMIISYIAGKDDPIRCDVLFATLSTFHINAFAFLALAVDKYVAIVFPLRYITIITDRVAYMMIFASWAISAITSVIRLFIGETYKKSSQYGVCVPTQESFVSLMVNFIAPVSLSLLGALIVDIYTSVVACKLNYRLHRHDIEGLQDTSVSQRNITSKLGRLKQNLDRITGNNIKPIVAVLIALASNSLLGFLCPLLFITVQTLETSESYEFYIEHIVIPNAAYIFLITYSLIFSLYFKNIRTPLWSMMKSLVKIICPSCVRRCCHLKSVRISRVVPVSGIRATQWTTSL